MITWNAPIYVYLWLAGMAGGAFFAAFLAERFANGGNGANGRLLRVATFLGIPLVVIGVILLIADLGQPIRFWHLLARFRIFTPMSMGTWILVIWGIVAGVMAVLWIAEALMPDLVSGLDVRRVTRPLSCVGFVFSALVMAYTGVLLAVSNQPLWAGSFLLPALFVASATSTGVALLIVTAALVRATGISAQTVGRLAEADAVLIVVELAVLVGYAIWVGGSGMAGAREALRVLTTGGLAAPFWAGVVLLGLLIPLGLELASWGKEIRGWWTWAVAVTSSLCVLAGGLILRAVIMVGGQV